MSVIIRFAPFHGRRLIPPLVFVEMRTRHLSFSPGFDAQQVVSVLANCRMLLNRTRAENWPLAFIVSPMCAGLLARTDWIEGFMPQRSDMVFEASGLSCYSSQEFADSITTTGGVFILAGIWGEGACLATLMDAPRYGHHVGLIEDAFATRPLPGCDSEQSHRAVVAIASRYATVVTTACWLEIAGTSN